MHSDLNVSQSIDYFGDIVAVGSEQGNEVECLFISYEDLARLTFAELTLLR